MRPTFLLRPIYASLILCVIASHNQRDEVGGYAVVVAARLLVAI
jgi:hypothetical protein